MPNARPRRLQAQPALASRFAVHASARPVIRRALAELPQEVSVEALTAAYDAWLEGTVATTIADGIATIPVRGVLTKAFSWWNYWLGWSAYDQLAHDVEAALKNPDVRGIILGIDSPGGQVDGLAELASLIYDARRAVGAKPIIAHVDGMAASAAYWLASAAQRVVLTPTAMAGSIGVVFSFVDWSGAWEQLGVRTKEIVSTQSPKKLPDPFEAEGHAQIQVHADAIAEVFLSAVATQRGTTRDTVAAQFGQGDVFVGQAAIDAGLADALGTFDATRRALVAQLDADEADVITVQVPRREARADRARVVAAITAAVDAACDTPSEESIMAGIQPTHRSAAATAAEDEDEEKKDKEKASTAEDRPSDEEKKDEEEAAGAEGETPADEDEEKDEDVAALAKTHGPVLARIRQRAAATERTRIAGIRALGRPGQETVLQACIDDPACTVEKAALALLQHEQGQRAAHLRGVRAEEGQLDAPDNRAAPEPSGDAAVASSIVSLFHRHNPKRRPAAAGRA